MSTLNTSKRKKIAIIVQRYGKQINGGAEAHARAIAIRLSHDHEVTVLTSRALDYQDWKPKLPPGNSNEEGVNIIRFNHQEKGLKGLDRFLYPILKCFFLPITLIKKGSFKKGRRKSGMLEQQLDLLKLKRQGPYMPDLLPYLRKNISDYDAFIFFTYLYYPTAMGIQEVGKKSILVPTIHDEPAVYRGVYQQVMSAPAEIFFNTDAEMKFSQRIFNLDNSILKVVASGIDIPHLVPSAEVLEKYGIQKPYLLYVGRVDEGKGCKELVSWHHDFANRHSMHPALVMVGKNHLSIKGKAIFTGFISEEDKHQILAQAAAVVVPSRFESLSLALLEGFAHGIPGIVNGKCEVLADHIDLSGAGWSYDSKEEFESALQDLMHHPEKSSVMGQKGKAYVEARYDWNLIMQQYLASIEKISSTD